LDLQIFHGGLDRRLVDDAVTLGGVRITGPHFRFGNLNGKKERRARREIAENDVAAPCAAEDRAHRLVARRLHGHHALDWFERNTNGRAHFGGRSRVVETEILQIRVRVLIRQRSHAAGRRVPAPTQRAQLEHAALDDVAGNCAADRDRSGHRIRSLRKLASNRLARFERHPVLGLVAPHEPGVRILYDIARVDRQHRRQRGIHGPDLDRFLRRLQYVRFPGLCRIKDRTTTAGSLSCEVVGARDHRASYVPPGCEIVSAQFALLDDQVDDFMVEHVARAERLRRSHRNQVRQMVKMRAIAGRVMRCGAIHGRKSVARYQRSAKPNARSWYRR
jgi:hypothetical protein